jgi:hypothetical protein
VSSGSRDGDSSTTRGGRATSRYRESGLNAAAVAGTGSTISGWPLGRVYSSAPVPLELDGPDHDDRSAVRSDERDRTVLGALPELDAGREVRDDLSELRGDDVGAVR